MSDAKDTIGAGLTAFAKKQVKSLVADGIGDKLTSEVLELLGDKVMAVIKSASDDAIAEHVKLYHAPEELVKEPVAKAAAKPKAKASAKKVTPKSKDV